TSRAANKSPALLLNLHVPIHRHEVSCVDARFRHTVVLGFLHCLYLRLGPSSCTWRPGPLRAYRYVRVLRAGRNGCSRDRTTSHRFNKVGRNVPYLCGSVEAETLHNFAIAVVGDIVLDLDNPRGYCSSLPTKIPSTIAGGVRRTASGYCQRWRLRADCPAPRQGTLPIRKGASLPPTARLLGWTAIDSVNAGTWHSIHSM